MLAELIHTVQVRMLQQTNEVSVPNLLLGRYVAISSTGPQEQLPHKLRRDDLQSEAQEWLDEAMLHSMAVIYSAVSLRQTANQQATLSVTHPLIQLNLKKTVKT